MKLAAFFDRIGPFLEGRAGEAETLAALYPAHGATRGHGRGRDSVDAGRVAIYARFCRIHRFEVLDGLYVACRRAVIARAGEAAWEALVEAYFRAHPMHHVDLYENGDQLGPFLVAEAARIGLPPWLAELADLEWWEWRTEVASDEPDAHEEITHGPLRLAATLELRPYHHDLVAWLDASDDERAAAPDAGDTVVVFWRDRDLDGRRESATPLELAVLRAVHAGAGLAAPAGVAPDAWEETIGDLHDAGILVGKR